MLQEENLNQPRSSEEPANGSIPETQNTENELNITPHQPIQIVNELNSSLPAVNLNKLDLFKNFLITLRDKIFTAFLDIFSSAEFLRILIYGIISGLTIGSLEDSLINEPYKNTAAITQIVSDTLQLAICAIIGATAAAFSIITHGILVTLYFKGSINVLMDTLVVSIFAITVELFVGAAVDKHIASIVDMVVDSIVIYNEAIIHKVISIYQQIYIFFTS